MLGEGATPADIGALRHQYGLDLPLHTQYIRYWTGVVHGDLGSSIRLHDTVGHPHLAAVPLYACTDPGGIGIRAGSGAACGDSGIGAARALARSTALSGFALRALRSWNCAGPVLILVFSIGLGRLPVSGANSGGTNSIDWRYLILPSVAMGASLAAILTRMVRTAMLEELGQDYIRTARAKGLSETAVVCRHALPNALVPIVTVVGLQFGALLAGAIVTETIFSWPGLGRLVVSAISNRDYALLQGCLLSIGMTYVLVNLLTDVVYRWVNPRMRG